MEAQQLSLPGKGLRAVPELREQEALALRALDLQQNCIQALPASMGAFRNVARLDLSANALSSLEGIQPMACLRILQAGSNQIKGLAPLSALVSLEMLDVHSNRVESLDGLQSLTSLAAVNAAGNRIQVLPDLSGMSSLTDLNLRRNALEGLTAGSRSALALPTSLQRLILSHNRFKDLGALQQLQQLTALSEVALDGCPVAKSMAPEQFRWSVLPLLPLQLQVLDLQRVTPPESLVLAVGPAKAPSPAPPDSAWKAAIQPDGLPSLLPHAHVPAPVLSSTMKVAQVPGPAHVQPPGAAHARGAPQMQPQAQAQVQGQEQQHHHHHQRRRHHPHHPQAASPPQLQDPRGPAQAQQQQQQQQQQRASPEDRLATARHRQQQQAQWDAEFERAWEQVLENLVQDGLAGRTRSKLAPWAHGAVLQLQDGTAPKQPSWSSW